MCIAGLQEDYREQEKIPQSLDIHTNTNLISSTLFSIISDISFTPLCFFFRNCVFYKRLL